MKIRNVVLTAVLSVICLLVGCSETPQTGEALSDGPFDLLVENARVVDGMGNPWFRADVGIRNGHIAEIGRLEDRAATRTIDAQDRILSPGFVDMMGGRTYPLLEDADAAESKLRQGITTMLAGEGTSEVPQNDDTIKGVGKAARLGVTWKTYAEYDALLHDKGLRVNVVHTVGAAQVRRVVMGVEDGRPTPAQMDEMKALVRQAMEDGAAGVSTALIYPPGTYATTKEIAELAKVAGEFGGSYFTHMRNESSKVLDAIREAIEIGDKGGVPVHIFHLKAAGEENWPLMAQSIALIENARVQGKDVTADVYPYVRNGIGLRSFLHPRHYAEGADKFIATLSDPDVRQQLRKEVETTSDWENWYRHVGMNWDNVLVAKVSDSLDKGYEGKSLAQIAKLRNSDQWTTFFDLVEARGVSVNPKSMNEEQKHLALRAEFISVDTDAWPMNVNNVSSAHPRAFGAFARILAKYVRDEGIISLEKAIRKMTSLPANRLRLYDRGCIAPGMRADLLIFDPANVQDNATFENPVAYSSGFDYVIVNGDSVHGILDADVSATADTMTVGGNEIKVTAERDPANLPWGDLGVDVAFECTGLFVDRDSAAKHLAAGAGKVLISAPGKNADNTIVYGVNHETLTADHKVVSNASCTTNCLAPVQIFNWVSRPQQEFHELAAGAIIVLLVVLLTMNGTAILIRHRAEKLSRNPR